MVSPTSQNSTSLGSKLVGSLFALVFLVAGLASTSFLGLHIYQSLVTYSWDTALCEVIASSVKVDTDRNYSVSVSYSYEYKGQSYNSTQFERKSEGSASVSAIQGYVDALEPGSSVPCYVNPEDPAEAVLRRSSLLISLAILFPLIFVAVGAGILYFIWKGESKTSAATLRRHRKSEFSGKKIALFLFGAFALCGGFAGYFFGVVPIQQYYDSQSWNETTCTVISSAVRSHSSDDGTTYSVDIFYSYDFNGKSYRGNSYNFSTGSSSGYQSKHQIVEQYPAGKVASCFVNPKKPSESVIVREMGDSKFAAAVLGLFFTVGVVGLFFTLRSSSKSDSVGSTSHYSPEMGTFTSGSPKRRSLGDLGIPESGTSGPTVLKPSSTPIVRLLGITLIALFWNGFLSVFFGEAYTAWSSGKPEYGMMLFLTPFVLVGAVLIFGVGYTFLTIFNPQAVITLGRGALPLGQTTSLSWQISGKTQRIRKLRFWLEGREEATYRRGTDTRTDKKTFREIEIYSSELQGSFARGQATIRVPADTMHSWRGSNNKIVWTFKVRGEIDNWPDLSEEFDFVVLPQPISKGFK